MTLQKPLLSLLFVAAITVSASSASAYSSLVVFGDSLSDSGNNAANGGINPGQVISGNLYIPTFAYASGTYSNGNVWVSSFASSLGLAGNALPSTTGGQNYAFGGARTVASGDVPSATGQLAMWQAANGPAAADSLFVVAVGGNDVRDTTQAAATNQANAGAIIAAGASSFAAGVANIVNSLRSEGAGTIIVWTAPDVGRTPFALAAGASGLATTVAASFNVALRSAVPEVGNVRYFDVFTAVNGAIAGGSFSNFTDACGAPTNACNSTVGSALFWDGIHPTAYGHSIVSQGMLAVAVPEPASVLLMALGVAGVVGASLSRRRVAALRA